MHYRIPIVSEELIKSTILYSPLFLCYAEPPVFQNGHGMGNRCSFHRAVPPLSHLSPLSMWLHWFRCRNLGSCWWTFQYSSYCTSQRCLFKLSYVQKLIMNLQSLFTRYTFWQNSILKIKFAIINILQGHQTFHSIMLCPQCTNPQATVTKILPRLIMSIFFVRKPVYTIDILSGQVVKSRDGADNKEKELLITASRFFYSILESCESQTRLGRIIS